MRKFKPLTRRGKCAVRNCKRVRHIMSALMEFEDGKLSGVHGALDADDHALVKLQVVAPMLDFDAEVLTADGGHRTIRSKSHAKPKPLLFRAFRKRRLVQGPTLYHAFWRFPLQQPLSKSPL